MMAAVVADIESLPPPQGVPGGADPGPTVARLATERRPFSMVRGRRTVDALLQATTQDLVVISGQADLKGSVLVTACCVIVSLSISNLRQASIRPGLLVIMGFSLPALVLAALAILPARGGNVRIEVDRNPLFFVDAATLSRREYVDELADICERDETVYEAIAAQIHALSCHLERTKFRYLRWGYLSLVIGVVAAAIVQATLTLVG